MWNALRLSSRFEVTFGQILVQSKLPKNHMKSAFSQSSITSLIAAIALVRVGPTTTIQSTVQSKQLVSLPIFSISRTTFIKVYCSHSRACSTTTSSAWYKYSSVSNTTFALRIPSQKSVAEGRKLWSGLVTSSNTTLNRGRLFRIPKVASKSPSKGTFYVPIKTPIMTHLQQCTYFFF
jgi:hypothetical protein